MFGETYLRDVKARLPRSVLHRYELASHLVAEDAPGYPAAVAAFLASLDRPTDPSPADPATNPSPADPATEPSPTDPAAEPRAGTPGSVLAQLTARAGDTGPAVVEVGGRSISWAELDRQVNAISAGMTATGLRPGDRVALLIPPSIDLTVALYAVWRAGGVIVVADKGLGVRGMGRALRGADLDHLIADTAGLLASRAMRLPGHRMAVRRSSSPMRRLCLVEHSLDELAVSGLGRPVAPDAESGDEAAVLFTSGATGPAKGVLYRHRQVRAQLSLIRDTYALTGDDRIVAAFAPFALYGPALGLPSVVPRTDVTKPGELTAAALGEAAAAIGATVVFASPAALRNVVATADALTAGQRSALGSVRLLMSAGASVPAELLEEVALVLPNADLHTPYGMTEALPLTDISLTEIRAAGEGDGVCVGRPLRGVRLRVAALDRAGTASDELTSTPGVIGEIWACASHIRDRYDSSWVVDAAAAAHPGWHRTGDVGFLDDQGRLWIQGRAVHVITTADGPVTPVGIELRVQRALEEAELITRSAAGVAVVGVGPAGTQQVVVVLAARGGPLAPTVLVDAVRAAAGRSVSAVLVMDKLPVDIRHNSKIDRVAVGRWAGKALAGG